MVEEKPVYGMGEIVLWKGKPAKVFGLHSWGNTLHHIHIRMLNNRRFPTLKLVSVKSKHLAHTN